MIELALNKLQKYYGANMVLEDITFEVQTSERVGIVGGNGCGKSTLLKVIMGIEGYENGVLSIRKGSTLGYLEQMPVYPDGFEVIDVLNLAFENVDSLYAKMEDLEKQLSNVNEDDKDNMDKLLNKYSELQVLYESLGGYEKEEKLSKVCNGLSIDDKFKEKLFSQLSGGEKTTVILGKILLQNPDILLLDEPSNHLDLGAMEWLENYLKEYEGIVIIVSHDRYFLDNVVTKIVEIEDRKSKSYIGNYTAFVEEKERQLELQMEEFLVQQKKINAMENSIARLRDWGARGDNEKFFRRAESMQKLLDKVERLDRPTIEKQSISINSIGAERSGDNVVMVEELSKSYGEKVLMNKADLLVRNGEAVALIGANGSGKSTLIKILLGLETADSGTAELGSSIKLGYLPQNVTFADENKTILECFRDEVAIAEGKAREYLARYMFFGESVFKKVNSISGGERSRLKLAILMHDEMNFLILDEPTNHLDIDSREELEAVLKGFKGTVFFISHDRYFINNISGRVVELSDGKFISYAGNYEYYKEKSLEMKNKQAVKKCSVESDIKIESNITNTKSEKASKPAKGGNNNEWRKANLEKQIDELEQSLKLLGEEINKFSDDYEKVNKLYSEKVDVQNKIDTLMEEYLK